MIVYSKKYHRNTLTMTFLYCLYMYPWMLLLHFPDFRYKCCLFFVCFFEKIITGTDSVPSKTWNTFVTFSFLKIGHFDLKFLPDFLKYWKSKPLSFSKSTFIETLELQLSLLLDEMCLLLEVFWVVTGRQNWFQRGEAMDHRKVLPEAMVGRQERFLNFRHSRMAKTVTFPLWCQPFNSFCFFILLRRKVGAHGETVV